MTSIEKVSTVSADRIAVRLLSILELARGTKLHEFAREDGMPLPAAKARPHIDVCLPNGLARQYSFILDGEPSPTYAVGVKDDPATALRSKKILAAHCHYE
jgi:hypothetical protein